MTTFVLLLVSSTAIGASLQPIVQTYDARSCREAKEVLGRILRKGELVCVPGTLVMPMGEMR
jgi:hypothetical protein